MAPSTRANGNKDSQQVSGQECSRMVIFTLGNLLSISHMVKEAASIQVATLTKVPGILARDKDMEL